MTEHDLISKAKAYRPIINEFRWSICFRETVLVGIFPNGIEVHFHDDGRVTKYNRKTRTEIKD